MVEMIYTRAPSSASYIRNANPKAFYTPAIPKRPPGSFEHSAQLGRGPSLGASGINIDSTTIFAALGGGIAVLASKSLPEPGPMVAQVLGYGAIGFAVYRAFFEGGAADSAPDKAAPGNPVPGASLPIAQTSDFSRVSGAFLSPTPAQKVGPGFLRTTYPVRIILSNGAPRPVSFYYQVMSTENPVYNWLVDKEFDAQVQGQVAQSYITLKPNDQKTIDLRVDVVTSGTLLTKQIAIELALQKKQSADAPWQNMGPSVIFEYSRSY